eukprot:g31992.t1
MAATKSAVSTSSPAQTAASRSASRSKVTGAFLHTAAPCVDSKPSTQGRQLLAATASGDPPGCAQRCPSGQELQAVSPGRAAKWPAAQSMQAVWADWFEKKPVAQGEQLWAAASKNDPGKHAAQVGDGPLEKLVWPGAQSPASQRLAEHIVHRSTLGCLKNSSHRWMQRGLGPATKSK